VVFVPAFFPQTLERTVRFQDIGTLTAVKHVSFADPRLIDVNVGAPFRI